MEVLAMEDLHLLFRYLIQVIVCFFPKYHTTIIKTVKASLLFGTMFHPRWKNTFLCTRNSHTLFVFWLKVY